jgi:Ni/Co efflux regulator RcnB
MKYQVLMAAGAALLAAGCGHLRAPALHAPRMAGQVHNPIEFAASGTYTYAGKRYRRWREDWIAPPGYEPHKWRVGETVPAVYLDGRFTIQWNKRKLPAPGEDRQWVRVGKDALLVDKSGRIDVVINGFYF